MRILLTGVGCPGTAGTIYALRNNPAQEKTYIVGVDILFDSVGKFLCDAFHQVPEPETAEYLPALQKIIIAHEIDIVIPQTTREIGILAKHVSVISCRVMVGAADIVTRYNHKHALLNMCERINLPLGAYHLASDCQTFKYFVRKFGYPDVPVVIKPAVGNGSRGVRILDSVEVDFDRFMHKKPDGTRITLDEAVRVLGSANTWPEMLIMEYLSGQEYTVDVLNIPKQRIIVVRKRNQIRSGISFVTELVDNPQIENQVNAILDAYPIWGAIGFQFKNNENDAPCILESNPRIQGTMIATCLSGVNIIWAAVEYFVHGRIVSVVDIPPKSIKFYRYWGGVGVSSEGRIII